MEHVIHVERDQQGLHQALLWRFEEHLIMHRAQRLEKDAPEAFEATLADIPDRELSPGYYVHADYLLDLALTLKLGVTMDAHTLTRWDRVGLAAVRSAEAEYQYDHPSCPQCGERQTMRGQSRCEFCPCQFRKES